MTMVITRFAPSPTGQLHIGGARTALFNWLFSKHNNGMFLIRIEDTDNNRSCSTYTKNILQDLEYINIKSDKEIVYQSSNIARHISIAEQLLKQDKAYYCFCDREEVELWQKNNPGKAFISPWRNKGKKPKQHQSAVIRIKSDIDGSVSLNDQTQGLVTVSNQQIDDFIILRSDGSPTYNLAVVIDDHDMKISHIIRGDDHLTNSFRQLQIYKLCNFLPPKFSHIPLISSSTGEKLSKRNKAIGISELKNTGILPDAICNYILRLGFSKGEEIISISEVIKIFDGQNINKSMARFDINKLINININYINRISAQQLLSYIRPLLCQTISQQNEIDIIALINASRQKANTLLDILWLIYGYFYHPIDLQNNKIIYPWHDTIIQHPNYQYNNLSKINNLQTYSNIEAINSHYEALIKINTIFKDIKDWHEENIKSVFNNNINDKKAMIGLRSAICGQDIKISLFKIAEIFGKNKCIARINKAIFANNLLVSR